MAKDKLGHGSDARNGAKGDMVAKYERMDSRAGPRGHTGPNLPNVMTRPFPNVARSFSAQPGRVAAHLRGVDTATRAGANWLSGRRPIPGKMPPNRIPNVDDN